MFILNRPTCIYAQKNNPLHIHTCTHIHLSFFLCLPLCHLSLRFAPVPRVPALVGGKCWQFSSPGLSLNNSLSHLTTSLILRCRCQELTFNFHTSPRCYSFSHEFYFRVHPPLHWLSGISDISDSMGVLNSYEHSHCLCLSSTPDGWWQRYVMHSGSQKQLPTLPPASLYVHKNVLLFIVSWIPHESLLIPSHLILRLSFSL